MRGRTEAPRDGETLDAFYHGRVRILQSRRGYRFSVDAPLLADFIRTRAEDEAIELGTGNGVVALLLSVRPLRRIVAVELQEGLAELARRNVELNGLGGRIEIVRADWRTYEPGRTFDLVFSNPPYIKRSTGFLSASGEKSAAKHELHGGIGETLKRTAELLAPDGRACFVYPEKRRGDFMAAAGEWGLAVRRSRSILPREGEPASLFLVELGRMSGVTRGELARDGRSEPEGGVIRSGEGLPETMPPLVLFGPDGKYTPAAEAVFSGPI